MQAPTTSEGGLDGRDPPVRPCPGCGAENPPSSTFCWRCYRAFEIGAPVGARTPSPSSWPPAPAPPGPLGHVDRPGSRLGLLGSIIAVTLGVVASIAFLTLREPSTSFPESFAGLERASDPQFETAAESFRAASQAQGLEGDMAFFAEGGVPVAALAWIRGAERTPDGTGEAFDGFTEGLTSGSNGSVVTSERVQRTIDGVTYVCAPLVGPVVAGICMWQDHDVFWILMDVRPGTTVVETRSLSVTAHAAAA